MMKKRNSAFGIIAIAAIAISTLVVPAAKAANEIVVWADETRGPNLQAVLKAKSDWVPGYTIKVVPFSSFDALKAAFDNATDQTGPDIVVAANDWVPTAAKSGKLAPLVLSAAVRAQFNPSQFVDLSFQKKLYGIPVDINNVAMIYNTKLVATAPKTFGDMVNYYKANKAAKGLKAGLCIAGGGMSWGAHSVFSALGLDAYQFNSAGAVVRGSVQAPTFGANVKTYLLDSNGKSNGFFPASDTGCKDNFLAGTVPFAVIGNWEWKDYVAKGFDMNLMPVPGVTAGSYGHMFASVSGALLTSYAAKHGNAAGAKSFLVNFFGSADGASRYEAIEGRPPANKGAQSSASVSAGQKGFGTAASLGGIPQIGAFLNNNAGGANYWDSAPAYWTAVLVDGKDPVKEAKKLAAIWVGNVNAGKGDL
ncbi:MAG: extracellular solute-binding protein [Actinomycetes bacterium]